MLRIEGVVGKGVKPTTNLNFIAEVEKMSERYPVFVEQVWAEMFGHDWQNWVASEY